VGHITRDDSDIFYKDWADGPPVVLCHGWPLSADSWDPQMLFLASNGFRCVAHDRRGHGRSTQTWDGNDMDTYADDLAAQPGPARVPQELTNAVPTRAKPGGPLPCHPIRR
jgi:pimeloyl-ACP methyl ester carboxylesterase